MKKLLALLLLLPALAFGQGATLPYIDPTGLSIPNSIAEEFDVLEYGAKCDDTTDDTTAINNAVAAARTQYLAAANSGAVVRFPPKGKCLITGSINATGFVQEGSRIIIKGNGAMLHVGGNAAVPVWDMLGSKNMIINDLLIIANSGHQTYGIQTGRVDTTAAGRQNTFNDVNVTGVFTQAACYNFAGELDLWINVYCFNANNSTGYGLILDGENHFNITSAFVTETYAVDTPVSFNSDTFLRAQFRSDASGYTPAWLEGTTGHQFIETYMYSNTVASPCVTLFNIAAVAPYGNNKGLHFTELHCEAIGAALVNTFSQSGPGSGGAHYTATPIISDMQIFEPYFAATGSLFKKAAAANLGAITYENLDLNIAGGSASSTGTIFEDKTDIVNGRAHIYQASIWNGPMAGVSLNLAGNTTFGGLNSLYEWGLPIILPSSGSFANNGVLTLTTALPSTGACATTSGCYMYFPINAIAAGVAAGTYYTTCSTTTACTVFNNLLTSGTPTIPASPTAFSVTGPGAYTQTSGSYVPLLTLPIPAGSMGANGALTSELQGQRIANADTVNQQLTYGAVTVGLITIAASNQWYGSKRTLRNLGTASTQVVLSQATSNASDEVVSINAVQYTSINTANAGNYVVNAQLVTAATDWYILFGGSIKVNYAP